MLCENYRICRSCCFRHENRMINASLQIVIKIWSFALYNRKHFKDFQRENLCTKVWYTHVIHVNVKIM